MNASPKKTIAVYAANGCRSCEHAILDINNQVQPLSRWADIVYWPYMLGSGEQELGSLDTIDVCFFTGAIRTDEDRRMAEKLREKSSLMVACGACSAFGGMPGLSNLKDLLAPPAEDATPAETDETQDDGPVLPAMQSRVSALSQIVAVDYVIPGCQPTQSLLWSCMQALVCGPKSGSKISFTTSRLPAEAAQAIAAGILPPKGFCFAGEKAVCASCSRVKEEKLFEATIRPYEKYEVTGRCLLEQGLVCLGIATREGCGGLCTGLGQPCRGCFGKSEAVYDPGAKMVSAISSTFASEDEDEIEEMAETLEDLSGTFYRYTAPSQCAIASKE